MRALMLLLLMTTPAWAERLTVVELFTSQGCSSCPPADALLTELATDPALLPLDFHVTYWDRLGWKDPYSLPAATARQQHYAGNLRLDSIYTPQMVVGGRREMVGHDRAAVQAALIAARRDEAVPLRLWAEAGALHIEAGLGPGLATLVLIGFDPQHTTPIHAGENGGRTLPEVNVVRAVAPAGAWLGAPLTVIAPRPGGERVAALLQASDGRILGAAVLDEIVR